MSTCAAVLKGKGAQWRSQYCEPPFGLISAQILERGWALQRHQCLSRGSCLPVRLGGYGWVRAHQRRAGETMRVSRGTRTLNPIQRCWPLHLQSRMPPGAQYLQQASTQSHHQLKESQDLSSLTANIGPNCKSKGPCCAPKLLRHMMPISVILAGSRQPATRRPRYVGTKSFQSGLCVLGSWVDAAPVDAKWYSKDKRDCRRPSGLRSGGCVFRVSTNS